MPFGVCLVFELAADIHIPKDVIQVPIELAKLLGNCPTYLITRPNSCQHKLAEYVNVIHLGEPIIQNDEAFQNEKPEKLTFSSKWYEEGCKLAAKYADVLMLFPHFGNPTKGALDFHLYSLLKGHHPAVYLKLDIDPRGFAKKIPSEHERKSVIRKFKDGIKSPIRNVRDWLKYLPITAISAESPFTLEMFTHLHPSLSSKTFLVKNCPPQAEILKLSDKETLIKHKKPIFMTVGRLSESGKAIDILLSAWIAFAPQYPNWKLCLVGSCEANFQQLWIKRLEEANISHTVEWTGTIYNRDILWDIYCQSSILVIPSRHESGPLIFVEAIVAGCAVISTPVGEVPYVLNETDKGIFPIDDVEALTKAMILFASNDTIRKNQLTDLANEAQFRQWQIQLKPIAERLMLQQTRV